MATPTVTRSRMNTQTRTANEAAGSARYVWALTRISLGSVFLWAFLDKLFGLGYSTTSARAWLNGGSPTNGFLSNTEGWFADGFQAIAGNVFVDWLFMLGLLGIGVALLLGVGIRIAAVSGATMMVLMYLAAVPGVAGTTNPFMDDHIVYALVLIGLALAHAGGTLGFGSYWRNLAVVKRNPWLE